MIAVYIFGGIIVLIFAIWLFLNCIVNDNTISGYRKRIKLTQGSKIMYVFAHPDDEVLMSGTIAVLKKKFNVQVKALYLTHGEDGPTGGIVEKPQLKAERTKELAQVKMVLGIEEMVIKEYPDRYLNTVDITELAKVIEQEANSFQPKYIFTTDDQIGLYGHSDHIIAGKATKLALKNIQSVEGLLTLTLPKNMIKLAMKMSKTFKERFDSKHSLPEPNLYINIYTQRMKRFNTTKCHKTQHQSMNDLQPYYNKIPPYIYYSIFNKEYFEFITKENISR